MSGTIKRKLVLANGMEFIGQGFGSEKDVIMEVVFNTSIVGYQEIMSDNSYCDQAIVMTLPLIGNYGVNLDDFESVAPACDALIVSERTQHYSHYEATKSATFFKQNGLKVKTLKKMNEESSEIIERIQKGYIRYIVNISNNDSEAIKSDGYQIRTAATKVNIVTFTSLDTLNAVLNVLEERVVRVNSIN